MQTDEPGLEYVPLAHVLQRAEPESMENEPAGQIEHDADVVAFEKVPGEQDEQLAAPFTESIPAPQGYRL
jgi:hypothetical protein